jgi:catechol 2,3-dioxygenase-like lactoylglutathione lyase family enzyme
MSDPSKTDGGPTSYGHGMPNPTFSAIGLVTADLPRSLAFYRDLGFEVPADAESAPHVEVPLPGGIRLLIDTVDTIHSFDPSWTAPTGSSRAGLALACGSPADVDSTYAAMTERGHTGHLEPWDAFWGMRYASLLDPDGNNVDLFAPLPSDGDG